MKTAMLLCTCANTYCIEGLFQTRTAFVKKYNFESANCQNIVKQTSNSFCLNQ